MDFPLIQLKLQQMGHGQKFRSNIASQNPAGSLFEFIQVYIRTRFLYSLIANRFALNKVLNGVVGPLINVGRKNIVTFAQANVKKQRKHMIGREKYMIKLLKKVARNKKSPLDTVSLRQLR